MKRFSQFLAGLLLFVVQSVMFNELKAQSNVYVNEAGRTRIVHNVDRIEYGTDSVIIRSVSDLSTLNSQLSTFKVDAVNLMSLKEKDLWRAKVMPERYLADFDYDIAFEESDIECVTTEPEVTDVNDKLYDDFVEHGTWSKTVKIVFDGADVRVTAYK